MAPLDHRHLNLLDGYPLLPCGGPTGKQPINADGSLMTKWQKASFSVDQIVQLNGNVSAVGTRTGPDADHLLILDIDGRSAVDICKKFACAPKDTGWAIRRDTDPERLKVAFHIPEDLRPLLTRKDGSPLGKRVLQTKAAVYDVDEFGEPKRDEKNRPITLEKQEAVELFYGSGQCVVLGDHKQSGGHYFWNGDPTKLDTPNVQWWGLINHIVDSHAVEDKERQPIENGTNKQSGPSTPCVICGRNTSTACTTFNDGTRQRINCYQGQTFSPPADLKVGVDLIERDGISYALAGYGFNPALGGFATFVEHIEKPAINQLVDSDDLDDQPLDEWIAERIGDLLDLRLTTEDTWAKEMAIISELTCRRVNRQDIERRCLEALADRWNLAISQHHSGKRKRRGANQTKDGEHQQMLVHGFLPWKRDTLLFGPAGVGKTTAAVALAWSVISGKPFLDHDIPSDIKGKVLFIGSDGGDGAYEMWQNAAEDFGIADDPLWVDGCFHWGADQTEGIGAWSCTPAGLLELKEELETNDYALVIIDSWKAILELAGIDFGIGPVGTVVRILQALIGQHCSALYLHHPSGNTKGKGVGGAGGNQNVNQIPYAVHELRVEPSSEDKPRCIRWLAHKLRGYQSREFLYRLSDDGLNVVEGDVITNASDRILITLGDLEGLGTATTSPAIKSQMRDVSEKTISNNLTRMRQRGLIKKTGSAWHLTKRGKFALNRLFNPTHT